MKSIFTLLLILSSVFSVGAQNEDQHLIMRSEAPLVLINDSILGNFQLLNSISKEHIVDLDIKKGKEIGAKKLFLPEAENSGLLIATVKKEIKTRTQQELNQFFDLEASNDIYVNGYLLEDKSFLISAESIKKIEVIPADDLFLKKEVLNISI